MTDGIPDPTSIEEQKAAFSRAVDGQFSQGTTQIIEDGKAKKQMLIQAAEQQKAQYRIKVQAQLEASYLAIDRVMNDKIFALQESHQQQKAGLEQQAALLTLEFRQKKAEEDLMSKQFAIQMNYQEANRSLAEQFEKTRDLNAFKPVAHSMF